MRLRALCLTGFLFAVVTSPPPAQQVDLPPELRARFGLLGPHIVKIGPGAGMLYAGKLDGPDKPEVGVLFDRWRSRLQLLRMVDGALEATPESTDGGLSGLGVGDVNGDGTDDLLLLDGRGRLTVRLRGAQARDLRPVEVGLAEGVDVLRAGDIDGDGRADAIVLTDEGLRTVTALASEPVVSAAEPMAREQVRAMEIIDADLDGDADLTVATDSAVWVRRGDGSGGFGPWLVCPVNSLYGMFAGSAVDGGAVATIQDDHDRVVEATLKRGTTSSRQALHLEPLPESKGGARPFAHGDVDGDGDADLVIADPERAQLIYLLEDGGVFRRESAPTLSGVDSVALGDVDGDGNNDVVVASSEERAVAWRSGANARDAFPERLAVDDTPTSVAVANGTLLVLTKTDKRQVSLFAKPPGAESLTKVTELERLTQTPMRLVVAELDGNDGDEVLFVQAGKGLRAILGATGDGTEFLDEPLLEVTDGAVSLEQRDGQAVLRIAQSKFARTARLGEGGQLEVLDQDHGPEGISRIDLSTTAEDGTVLYVDGEARRLWIRPPAGAARSVDLPKSSTTHLLAHGRSALLLTADGVLRVPFTGETWRLEVERVYEPPLEETDFYFVVPADLDHDGRNELAVGDDDIHGFFVLSVSTEGLKAGLLVPAFELTQGAEGGYEPREVAAADLDGDGRTDLIALCHDRVLVWPQQP